MLVIKKRTVPIWNVLLFICISFIFLFILNSIFYQKTALSWINFLVFYNKNNLFFIFSCFLSLLIYLELKWSKYFFLLYSLFAITLILSLLVVEFDKLVFIGLTIFTLLFYYYYLFLSLELKKPILNPNFSYGQLNITPRYKLPIQLKIKNSESGAFAGTITNWSINQCFILMDSELPKEYLSKIVYYFSCNLNGKNFEFRGRVFTSTKDMMGLGIYILESNKMDAHERSKLGWREYYNCLEDLGYLPDMLV